MQVLHPGHLGEEAGDKRKDRQEAGLLRRRSELTLDAASTADGRRGNHKILVLKDDSGLHNFAPNYKSTGHRPT